MAVSKLGTSTLGGAAAGAQIGTALGGPVGTAIGAGVGALGGLAVGALQKDSDAVKARRMQARVDKLRGKGKTGKARKWEEKMLEQTGATGELYKQQLEAARSKVRGDVGPMVIQSGSDPTAGQQRLSGEAGPDLRLQGEQAEKEEALAQGMHSEFREATALGDIQAKQAGAEGAAAFEAGVDQEQAAHTQQALQTGVQIGSMGSQMVTQARAREAMKGMDTTPAMNKKFWHRDENTGDWVRIKGTPGIGYEGYATNRKGEAIQPPPLPDDLKHIEIYDPTVSGGVRLLSPADQRAIYKQAVADAEAQKTYHENMAEFDKWMGGYRPRQGYGMWDPSMLQQNQQAAQQGTAVEAEED